MTKEFKGTNPDKMEPKNESGKEAPENNYEQYKSLGGIINENDYQSALDRMDSAKELKKDSSQIIQALNMSLYAKIELNGPEKSADPRVLLYATLREDAGPKDNTYHYSQMSDQRLFAEALRMLGDEDSLKKMVETLPHIFNWPSDKIG
ncbi:MAG: hypothetical protein Q7S36_02760 [Candidatus Liptonbacteria bacterium]|nr:hypothetical protein [Candidatus Liptonbacteria bacterium]